MCEVNLRGQVVLVLDSWAMWRLWFWRACASYRFQLPRRDNMIPPLLLFIYSRALLPPGWVPGVKWSIVEGEQMWKARQKNGWYSWWWQWWRYILWWCVCFAMCLDSIAASLFENNWLCWQMVSNSIRWQDPNDITDTGARCLVYVCHEKSSLLPWSLL